jgi:hypothetical protein
MCAGTVPLPQRRLMEEYERCTGYLEAATRKPLISTVEQQLVAAHISNVLERGFSTLVDGCRCGWDDRVGGHVGAAALQVRLGRPARWVCGGSCPAGAAGTAA